MFPSSADGRRRWQGLLDLIGVTVSMNSALRVRVAEGSGMMREHKSQRSRRAWAVHYREHTVAKHFN